MPACSVPQWEAEFKDKSDLVQHKKKARWLEKGTDICQRVININT